MPLRAACFAAALSLGLVATAGEVRDPADNAEAFYDASESASVAAGDGVVRIRKSGVGDAFVRWSPETPKPAAIDPEADRLEVVVSEIRGGARLQVKVQVFDASKKSMGNLTWIDERTEPGTLVLEDIGEFAAQHRKATPHYIRLQIRVEGRADESPEVVIDEIRIVGNT